jgi:hypothetical protein
MNELDNVTTEEMFQQIISWAHEYKSRKLVDQYYCCENIRELIDEIQRRQEDDWQEQDE